MTVTVQYPVLYAPQTGAPIYPTTSIVVLGVRMQAATALTRWPLPDDTLSRAGFSYPTAAQIHAVADGAICARAIVLARDAKGEYSDAEAIAWPLLEVQARAYLADPTAPVGVDLAADAGPGADIGARAASIVAKADVFRAARGAIVRWRREARTALDAALAEGATGPGLIALATVWLAQVDGGLPA